MNALQTKWGTRKYMLVEIEELIWVNVGAPHSVEGDGQLSRRLLASKDPENAGEPSHVLTCTIRMV
jgi:hypothetical protein